MMHSAPISTARSAPAVSVVKNGLPVPAAKMTTRRFSRWRMARRRMYGSATARISMADRTRVSTPSRFRACRRAPRPRASGRCGGTPEILNRHPPPRLAALADPKAREPSHYHALAGFRRRAGHQVPDLRLAGGVLDERLLEQALLREE